MITKYCIFFRIVSIISPFYINKGNEEKELKFLNRKGNPFDFLPLNMNPVIGIMTQISSSQMYPAAEYSYIAGAYERGQTDKAFFNCRIVPVPYEADNSTLEMYFQKINGLFIPGGASSTRGPTKLAQAISYMLHRAMQAYDSGDYFPIMGECMGLEAFHYILTGYDDDYRVWIEGNNGVLHFLSKVDRKATLYKEMTDLEFEALTTQNISYFHHIRAISPNLYKKYPKLDEIFQITALDYDLNGTAFIASAQGKKYPFYGTQYHLEKSSFEFKVPANHSKFAVKVSQAQSNSFVQEARKSLHEFVDVDQYWIYNHQVHSFKKSIYNQIYFFKKDPPDEPEPVQEENPQNENRI